MEEGELTHMGDRSQNAEKGQSCNLPLVTLLKIPPLNITTLRAKLQYRNLGGTLSKHIQTIART
jgi:hypothetical protein